MANELPAVVLVEDDDRLRNALARVLSMSGFRVATFAAAEAALAGTSWANVACLVVDIRLPGMSGLELLRHLRKRGNAMPAVVMTADLRRGLREAAMELDVRAYLEKPVGGHVLGAAVREAISRRVP